jgi:hypothetical protein
MLRPVYSSSAARPCPITRPHVAAGQADARKQERGLAARGGVADVGRQRQHGARAHADAIDGRDDRLRARAHGLDYVARHARKGQQRRHGHLGQGPDDVMDVAPGTKVLPRAGEDHCLHLAGQRQRAEQVAQLGVGIKSEGILALGPVQGQRGDPAVHVKGKVARVVFHVALRARASSRSSCSLAGVYCTGHGCAR